MTGTPDVTRPLAGVKIVEISSFVAVPLAGMTLGQLGAEVIRVDPIGGAADYRRWPLTGDGESIYWAGLNKGKRSVAADMRSAEGQDVVQRLIADSGVLITNVAGRDWHSYDTLTRLRPDLIHVEVSGRADGGTGVDYTVNAAIGFPTVTGPAGLATPVNHVLPAWDVACGVYTALAVVTALRHRDATGQGQQISIPLENVALATAGNLSFFTEAMINGTARERIGNSVYGQYGQDFTSSDGASFMIVALTGRHFRDLTELTGTTKAVAATGRNTRRGFHRRRTEVHPPRSPVGIVQRVVFATHRDRDRGRAVGEFRAVGAVSDVRRDGLRRAGHRQSDVQRRSNQPRIGEYLAPGLPMSIDGVYPPAVAAPALGDDTGAVLAEWLSLSPDEIKPARRIGHRRMSALLRLLALEQGAGEDTWIGPASGPDGKRSYGGQFVAQSLAAACRTVDPDRPPTNMHLQFLRGGEAGDVVEYTVTRVFDGRTAAARRVDSHQGGRLLTTATVSFAAELPGPEHGKRASMPHDPDTLAQTGPIGPAPSMPLDELDIRISDEGTGDEFVGDCGGGQRLRFPTTRWCTRWSRRTSPTST